MLRPATYNDLEMMLEWRNATSVRRVMLNEHVIDISEHEQWWQKVESDPSKRVLIMQYNNQPVAVVNFFDIDYENASCHWGFYMNPSKKIDNPTRLSIWLKIEENAIDYAFHQLGVRTLFCETLQQNEQVLRLHERYGFQITRHYQQQRRTDTVEVVEMSLQNPKFSVKEIDSTEKISFTFMGSANWDIASTILADSLNQISGIAMQDRHLPYGQYRSYIHNSDSSLYTHQPGFYLFCERLEDLGLSAEIATESISSISERFETYLEDIRLARKGLNGHFLILDLFPLTWKTSTLDGNFWSDDGLFTLLQEMNRRLAELCKELVDCYLISLSSVISQHGQLAASPGKYWNLGKLPYSHAFTTELATLLTKWVLSIKEKTVRAIIVDLDNTLWQGVIGDDGIDGIALGGDFPGNLYTDMQRCLKHFHNQGLMLAICSKNTESIAMEAISNHPQMLLREKDFAARRINWDDKAENIQQLASELSLGLGSIMFIDDSPYERAAVRQRLPHLIVAELPMDPADWPDYLMQHPYLAIRNHGQSNIQRTESLVQRNLVMQKKEQYQDRESFWASFESKICFTPLNKFNQQRILQLIAKTNQFNMTSVRYNASQITSLIDSGYHIYAINISDKFAPEETAGVLITRVNNETGYTVDNFILSCRYLGRGIEPAIFSWLKNQARKNHCTHVDVLFIPTTRNQPAKESLEQEGFVAKGEIYTYTFENNLSPKLANWVTYEDVSYANRHIA